MYGWYVFKLSFGKIIIIFVQEFQLNNLNNVLELAEKGCD